MDDNKNGIGLIGTISAAGAGAGAAIATAAGIAVLPASALAAGICLVVYGVIKFAK